MSTRSVLAALLFLLAPCAALAQTPDVFFPLGVGDTRTYIQVIDPPFEPADTLWYGPYSTTGTVSVNDTLYHVARHPFALGDTLRSDGEGRIFARIHDEDRLLFDFTLDEGASYTFSRPGYPANWEVTIERGLTVTVGAGTFDGVVRLWFDDPQSLDEEHSWWFAPGVGIVAASGILGDYCLLFSAEVDGRTITTTEPAEVPRRPAALSVYPNPFSVSTTIVVPSGAGGEAAVDVYDLLGRRVATLVEGSCGAGECHLTWTPTAIPPSTYFALSRSVDAPRAIPVVLRR